MGAVVHIDRYKKGHYFRNETRGDMSWNGYEYNVLMHNEGVDENGIPHFTDVAMALGADDIRDSRGIAMLDFDHDGDLDVAVSHNPGDILQEQGVAPSLYRNDIGQSRSWLAVELQGTRCNRDAVGAEVTVEVLQQNRMRLVSAGSGYASQQGQRLYFGLDAAERVDRLTVRWPGGDLETFKDIQARQLVRITQGSKIELMALPPSGRIPYASQQSDHSTEGMD